jgi:hypothetical protein
MDAQLLASLLEESPGPAEESPFLQTPSPPSRALPRTYPSVPQRDPSIELTRTRNSSIRDEGIPSSQGPEEVVADEGAILEPESDNGVEALQSVWDPHMNRYRLLSACLMNFANGVNDSAPGALIPYMEKYALPPSPIRRFIHGSLPDSQ